MYNHQFYRLNTYHNTSIALVVILNIDRHGGWESHLLWNKNTLSLNGRYSGHLIFFINTWCYHIYNIPIGFSDLENVGVDTKFVFPGRPKAKIWAFQFSEDFYGGHSEKCPKRWGGPTYKALTSRLLISGVPWTKWHHSWRNLGGGGVHGYPSGPMDYVFLLSSDKTKIFVEKRELRGITYHTLYAAKSPFTVYRGITYQTPHASKSPFTPHRGITYQTPHASKSPFTVYRGITYHTLHASKSPFTVYRGITYHTLHAACAPFQNKYKK